MTATPRIYADSVRRRVAQHDMGVFSMDNETIYGKKFYHLSFTKAVDEKMLCDYRVIVLVISEEHTTNILSTLDKSIIQDIDLPARYVGEIIGCYKALRDQGKGDIKNSPLPQVTDAEAHITPSENGKKLKRAVSFSNTIANSKKLTNKFNKVIEAVGAVEKDGFRCELKHVDGRQTTLDRARELDWLREGSESEEENTVCHILSNARCLTEGVDVPSLDAIMFMNPRRSQIDVIQAVGRVMRKAEGKEYGYAILPVIIPTGQNVEEALENDQAFQVVWQVLKALRSHDENLNNTINKLELNKSTPNPPVILCPVGTDKDGHTIVNGTHQRTFNFSDNLVNKIYAKIVDKVGDRRYLDHWAKDTAELYNLLVQRIDSLRKKHSDVEKVYHSFLNSLHASIHDDLGEKAATGMLAQQLITKPIFKALFEDYKFNDMNPVSITLDEVLTVLNEHGLDKELEKLSAFYDSVKSRVSGLDNDKARQTVITELYEKFFIIAFPKISQSLGIAYTPIELVDFTLASADQVMQTEFARNLSDEGVHIIDPFTGTGSFIVRLLQNPNLIKDKDICRKFTSELWANEILLLAYYIACVNIEMAFHQRSQKSYTPFPGISLTDTFELFEKRESTFPEMMAGNKSRIKKQIDAPIRVIIGNPPWSAGQKRENENNPNRSYDALDDDIQENYASRSTARNVNSLYDHYIRAIRWASNRIHDEGIIAIITNAGWLDGVSADGMRLCIEEEFDAIWVFHLRGNIRRNMQTNGDAQEGENVFGQKTQNGVCVNLLVKNPKKAQAKAKIYYYDIGDNIKRKDKLEQTGQAISINGIESWRQITPNKHGDWAKQRDPAFEKFIEMGNDAVRGGTVAQPETIFRNYSSGIVTRRDAWAYNFNGKKVATNMEKMIDFYNTQCDILTKAKVKEPDVEAKSVLDMDGKKIGWDGTLISKAEQNKKGQFDKSRITSSIYYPFTPQFLYFDSHFNSRIYRQKSCFPKPESENQLICVTGRGANSDFSCLMVDMIPSSYLVETCQCFPRYSLHEDTITGTMKKEDNITKHAINLFHTFYNDQNISKDDIFYYVYGLLHAPDYRERFTVNLRVGLPRIPLVPNFQAFADAGKKLAQLHLEWRFENNQSNSIELDVLYKNERVLPGIINDKDWMLKKKMKLEEKNGELFVKYNDQITIGPIPQDARKYRICHRTPLEWIVNRYKEKTDTSSGIINDPNDWINQQTKPDALFQLIKRVTYISIETAKIIDNLPKAVET